MKFRAEDLPTVAAVDTGVLIRFLGDRDDANTEQCKDFCEAILQHRHELLVPAPCLAEVARGRGARVPLVRGIQVIPFDAPSAHSLGLHLPQATLNQAREDDGLPGAYWKFDALVLACAIRWEGRVLVSLDERLRRLAARVPFDAREPREFSKEVPQLPLPHVP